MSAPTGSTATDAGVPAASAELHDGVARQHYGVTLAVLAVAALAYSLLQTMVAPALPAIQRDLHATTNSVTWVLTVYLLSASVATPIFGRLGDIFGKEHLMLVVLGVFAVGCLVAALSHSLAVLVAARAIQGAGGAVFPLAFGIIRDEFPRERVGTGIGLISATFGIGGGAGLVLSGLIVDRLSYEWIFWFGLAMTLAAMVATRLFVPESPVKTPARIDWGGALLLSGALVCLLLGVSHGNSWGWSSAGVLGLFGAAVAAAAAWAAYEQRVTQPLVDMRLLRQRGVWTTNLVGLLVGFGMFGSFILIPQFVQAPARAGYGFASDVTGAGLFLLPSAAVMLIAGPLAGALGNRFGSKLPLQIGSLLASSAFVLLAVAHTERWHIYLSSTLLGMGIGFAFASMANLIVQVVPQAQTGEATGMNTIMRTIGGALGAQIAASIVAGHASAATHLPTVTGYTDAFVMSAAGVFTAFLAGLAIPSRPPPDATPTAPATDHNAPLRRS
jgi:EmrB/QacA subfamily drug resistance transporter